jgi:hypothetical protein
MNTNRLSELYLVKLNCADKAQVVVAPTTVQDKQALLNYVTEHRLEAFRITPERAIAALKANGGIGYGCYSMANASSREYFYRRLEAERRYLTLSERFGMVTMGSPIEVRGGAFTPSYLHCS